METPERAPRPEAGARRRPRASATQPALTPWRAQLYEIIYEARTPAGRAFDTVLIVVILLSVVVVMLDSVQDASRRFGGLLHRVEWGLTAVFTIEYALRVICVKRPWSYVRSFFGVVDVLAILPTYLSLFFPGSESLLVVRFLRLLRIFRVFKLAEYLREAEMLKAALVASRRKISVFLIAVLTLVVIIGAVMHLVEGRQGGFRNIPISIYWTIVTLTTVGFGDITPRTPLGQFLASIVMLIGYSIIAVPTGIVTAEITRGQSQGGRSCASCGLRGHDAAARFCQRCGTPLTGDESREPAADPGRV